MNVEMLKIHITALMSVFLWATLFLFLMLNIFVFLGRKSFDMYGKLAAVESSEFKQEALINSASSLCDWAEVTLELPAEKAGGIAATLDLLKQADERYVHYHCHSFKTFES